MTETSTYELFMQGLALLDGGHSHQAAVILERASQQEPDKASIREALARALFNSGRKKEAAKEFDRTLELNPANHYAHFGLGLCRAAIGDKRAALGHLKMAVAMRPDFEEYRDALDRALQLGGAEAIKPS